MAQARVSGLRRFGALLQKASEPVYLLDSHRRLVYANRAWEQLTGISADRAAGLQCPPLNGSSNDGYDEALNNLARNLAPPPEALDGIDAGGPLLIVRPGGEHCWRRALFTAYRDADGAPLAWLARILPFDTPTLTPDSPSKQLSTELLQLRERLRSRYGTDALLGSGPAHQRLLEQVRTAAASEVPVFIVGEPGTGKRAVARVIHQLSSRGQEPLLPLDCAALPADLLERELLRYLGEKTTSPDHDNKTPQGTLLLTSITSLPRDLQAQLLPVIEQGRYRLLATDSLDPDQARKQERLRTDLFYALTTLTVRLEPLRDRLAELPVLAQAMLERTNSHAGNNRRSGFDPEALAILAQYDWPGNLGQLHRVVEAAHAESKSDPIRPADLPAAIQGHRGGAYLPPPLPEGRSLDETLTTIERRLIELALTRARHNKSRAADLLKISRPRLYRRIKELDLPDVPEPTEAAEELQT